MDVPDNLNHFLFQFYLTVLPFMMNQNIQNVGQYYCPTFWIFWLTSDSVGQKFTLQVELQIALDINIVLSPKGWYWTYRNINHV